MRRGTSFALIASLLLVLFSTACGTGSGKTEQVDITVWNYYIGEQKKAFDDMVSEFNLTVGQEQGVVLETISKASVSELNDQIAASINKEPGSEPLPDLFFAYADIAYLVHQSDLLVDFNRYVEQSVLDEYVEGFLNEGKIQGDDLVYILPAAKSTEVVVVNRTDFDAFCQSVNDDPSYGNVSIEDLSTWDGIVRASETYYQWTADQDERGLGKALFGLDSVSNYLFSAHKQLGVELTTVSDGRGFLNLTNDAFSKVWEHYYIPFIKGHYGAYGRFRSDDFKTGEILAFLGASSSGAYLSNEITPGDGTPYSIEISVLPMPVFENGQPVAIQQGAGMAVIQSTPERENAACLFATWFTETERNIAFATEASYLPVKREAVHTLAVEAESSEIDDVVGQVFRTSILQVDSGYEMYTPPVFDAAYEVRTVLERQMEELAEENRLSVQAAAQAGEDVGQAVEQRGGDGVRREYIQRCTEALSGSGVTVR